jgi:7-keto-8-aminopelargonate synthetase-like enzyme
MVLHRGRKLIYFGGCDYFRLASHPEVLRALREGADKFGLNVAASRSTTGNHVLFGRLEKELARFFGVERAALLSNGYATNLAFTQTFAGEFTHALMDERSHGSPRDAVNALDCSVRSFRHRDIRDFRRKLSRCGRAVRPLVITDGMFSQDGSLAPLPEYLDALPRNAVLLVDDAHGAGTLGRRGRGTLEVCGVHDTRVVQTISLSKAFGVYGGAVLGTAKVIEAIQNRSRIFSGNTPPPLPLVNAALASLTILKADTSLRRRLKANTARIKDALRTKLPLADNASPIVAFHPRDVSHASRISRALLRAGVFPSLIHYGGTPPPGYFRFAISSEHTFAQLDRLAEALIQGAAGARG